ncbi:MAG: IstB domain protein ATP-binding protein [Desulfotomaculum sp. 46_296]|nr:MAG: IstB domain protein ATP-binding protein [Desulfotomaculum sp. 46_296]HAU31293.1 AAA family ATPase [Desulfotomaculum sp.]
MEFCKLCHDRGVIISNDIAVPCTCGPQRALSRRLKESGLPKILYTCTFESFDFSYYQIKESVKGFNYFDTAKRTYQAALDFVTEFKKSSNCDGLFISGPVGSGKTFLACCIANALLAEGFLVLFVIVPDLLDHIRFTYNPNSGSDLTEQDLLETARQVPLLILDDLGSHNYTEWVRNKIYSILNHRLNYCLPTIITTNINLEDLDEFLGERTTSRIYQMCRPYRLMVSVDIRVAQRKKNQK